MADGLWEAQQRRAFTMYVALVVSLQKTYDAFIVLPGTRYEYTCCVASRLVVSWCRFSLGLSV